MLEGKVMHSIDDADKYCKLIYWMVNRDKRVPTVDKMDVAHDALLKVMEKNKKVNLSYIKQTTNSVIYDYMNKKCRHVANKVAVKQLFYSKDNSQTFSEFDFSSIPITEKEKEQLITYFEEDNKTLAEKEGIEYTALRKRKSRFLQKMRDKVKEKKDGNHS